MSDETPSKADVMRVLEENGRYLIPRISGTRTEKICQELVNSGHARWLGSSSNLAPGISPTGKPFEAKLEEGNTDG
jgi:hypothetical protein